MCSARQWGDWCSGSSKKENVKLREKLRLEMGRSGGRRGGRGTQRCGNILLFIHTPLPPAPESSKTTEDVYSIAQTLKGSTQTEEALQHVQYKTNDISYYVYWKCDHTHLEVLTLTDVQHHWKSTVVVLFKGKSAAVANNNPVNEPISLHPETVKAGLIWARKTTRNSGNRAFKAMGKKKDLSCSCRGP